MGGGRNLTPQPNRVWTHDYCVNNGLYVQRPKNGEQAVPNSELTYLLLSGWNSGRVKITDPAMERGFLLSYTKDLFEGCKELSYVQLRTQYFRFFMDLDIKRLPSAGVASPTEVRELIDVALDAILEFVPDQTAADLTAYVCTSLPSVSEDVVKCGAHLHVPGLVVDSHTARTIRELIVRRAKEHWPDGSPHKNCFEDIFDEVVYHANGIRMIGSVKYNLCRLCHRGDASCTACGGYGKLVDTCEVKDEFTGQTIRRGRTYSLTEVLRLEADGYTEDVPEVQRLTSRSVPDMLDMVTTLSIRTEEEAVVEWLKVPPYAEMPRQAVKASKSAPKGAPPKVYDLYPDDVTGMNKQVNDYREVTNGETLELLKRVLEEVIVPSDPRRKGIWLKKARERKGMYIMYPGGPGSTLCANKKGDGMHRSNSIYFTVTASGVVQRCFSNSHGAEALADRVHGVACKDFKSRTVRLNGDIRRSLFPIETIEEDRRRATHQRCRVAELPPPPEQADPKQPEPGSGKPPRLPKHPKPPVGRRVRPPSDRPPSGLGKRTREDPTGHRRSQHHQLKVLNMAIQKAMSRGPPATKCKVAKVAV